MCRERWKRVPGIEQDGNGAQKSRGMRKTVSVARQVMRYFQPYSLKTNFNSQNVLYHSLTSSPLLSPHTYTPPTCPLCSPQKSSDSWKVLDVYSVTTKQNHLKTKWAGECAGAIWSSSLCGRGENGLSESRGWRAGRGRHAISIHRLYPYSPTQACFYHHLLSTPHTPKLLSAPFKGDHAIWNRTVCVTASQEPNATFHSLFLCLLFHFHLLCSHLIFRGSLLIILM